MAFDEQDILSGQEDSKTMVVTETSKVHNDYEFASKDTLHLLYMIMLDLEYEQSVVVSIW